MTFAILSLIGAVALTGPVLALWPRWRIPVVIGELAAGILLGPMVLHMLTAADPTFTFLADIGFALVMFVAGTHVPLGPRLRSALPRGLLQAGLVGLASVPVAFALARLFGTGHTALYAVLLSSSSAALVLPIVDNLQLDGPGVLQLLPQVAVADTACIIALPLAIDPSRAGRAALGALIVMGCATGLYVVLRELDRRGWRKRIHRISERGKFALELRMQLALLFALAAVAQATGVSIMLAGFAFGLVMAASGQPRRLARQLFGVTEGFFAPLFFIWLGASLDLRALGQRPALIGLGVLLGLAAALTHLVARLVGQPVPLGLLACAQLGVPVAAATLGTSSHVLVDGEPAALMLGALATIALASAGASAAARRGATRPAES